MSRILKTIQKIIKGAYTGSISELKNTKNGVKKGRFNWVIQSVREWTLKSMDNRKETTYRKKF